MAQNNWQGRAAAISQIDTITIAGTWSTNDTVTMKIGGAELTVTVGSDTATTDVAAAIKAAWEGDDLVNDESRTTTGDEIPQFADITATVSGSVVTLTHDEEGRPFVMTVTETAATGTATQATSQSATGPNHVDNAENWSNGAVPGAGDAVVVENTTVSLLYGIDQLSGTITSWVFEDTFEGECGLPLFNPAGYAEYLPTFLDIDVTTLTIGGVNGGGGSSRIKVNTGTVQTAITVINTGSPAEAGIPAVCLKGSHASNTLEVHPGASVGVAMFGGETAQYATIINSGDLIIESGVTIATIQQRAGTLFCVSNITTLTQTGGASTVRGSATVGTLTLDIGICYYRSSGTCAEGTVGGRTEGALLDLTQDASARTFTDLTLKQNGSVDDPHGSLTVTNNIQKDSSVRRLTAA